MTYYNIKEYLHIWNNPRPDGYTRHIINNSNKKKYRIYFINFNLPTKKYNQGQRTEFYDII